MKANGKTTKNGEWVLKLIQTSQFTKEALEITREKEKESICIQTEISIKETGWMALSTVLGDISLKIQNTNIMETLCKTFLKASDKKNFLTGMSTRDNIQREKCMDMEFLNGEMGTNTMANGSMVRNVVRVA